MRFDGAPSSTERSTECPSSVDSDTRGGGSCIVLPSLRSDGSGDALSTAVVPDADMDDAMDTRGERSFCEPIVLTLKRLCGGMSRNEMMLSRRLGPRPRLGPARR